MPDSEKDKGKYGEEHYKAMGSPMFTKLWTFEELETVERPQGAQKRKRNAGRDFKRPDNWPDDTQVDPGTWVRWLPEGWAQGIRAKASGKKLSCYFNPEGRRFWHKKDVEKFLGKTLPDGKPQKVEDEDKGPKKRRYITDADAIPNWPDDEEDWLPKNFKVAFRQLPSGVHRVYIPPGYEDEGFLYHRSAVMDWVAGKVTTVSPFGSSKPMAEISRQAEEKGTGGGDGRTQ